MAYLSEFVCLSCHEDRMEVQYGGVCSFCQAKEANKKKRLHLAALKGLTVEERLDLIERQLYDLNINDRLKYLESKHATYA